jgi:hypothetical protein
MANIVQLTIGVTPSLSSFDCELVGSFVGPDFTLRGGGCVLQCVRVEYKDRQNLDLLVGLRSVDACSCTKID